MLKQQSFGFEVLIAFQEVYISSDLLLLSRLDDLIDLHFRKQKDPDFYSRELAYTTRTLNRITKLFRGRTVFGLIQDRVVVEAKLLLCHSRLSVKLINYKLGFEDPAYFCRFFKKMTGTTPQLYRKQNEIEDVKREAIKPED